MKTKQFPIVLTLACVLWMSAQAAQAFYNPSTGRWLSRDPIGEDAFRTLGIGQSESLAELNTMGTKQAYTFVRNNPGKYQDVLGLWPSMHHWLFYAMGPLPHQNAIRRQLLNSDPMSSGWEWLFASVEDVDKDQDTGTSYKHAMSAPMETPLTAKNRANFWVRYHLIKAQQSLCKTCDPVFGDSRRENAYWEFGQALHTIQDATSPAHAGFQTWRGLGHPIEASDHLEKESFDPGYGSRLDRATAWLWSFFKCTKDSPSLPVDFFHGLGYDHALTND